MTSEPFEIPAAWMKSSEYDVQRMARGHAPGVTYAVEAVRLGVVEEIVSVFCDADHGDGPKRWRVAIVVRVRGTDEPPRIVSDDDNQSWVKPSDPLVPARCEACWRVLCGDCYREGVTEFCPHNHHGEGEIDIKKLKALVRAGEIDVSFRDACRALA